METIEKVVDAVKVELEAREVTIRYLQEINKSRGNELFKLTSILSVRDKRITELKGEISVLKESEPVEHAHLKQTIREQSLMVCSERIKQLEGKLIEADDNTKFRLQEISVLEDQLLTLKRTKKYHEALCWLQRTEP